jgi:hypothetical protein
MRFSLPFVAGRREDHNKNEERQKDKCNKCNHGQRDPRRPRKRWRINSIFVSEWEIEYQNLGRKKENVCSFVITLGFIYLV